MQNTKAKKSRTAERPMGRPTDYRVVYDEQARKLCLLGATDKEMADFFDVSEVTLNAWKKAHPDFLKSLTRGKMEADADVASRLYDRAMGWSHDAVKIFMPAGAKEPIYAPYREQLPPDTQAASLWLRNRQPTKWRDKTEHELSGKLTLEQLVALSGLPASRENLE
jgi:hypothetical protein